MSILIELRAGAGPILVVGGGNVALRKVRTLAAGGFAATVVAPDVSPDLEPLAEVIERRLFEEADIGNTPWALVMACTGSREVNRRVGELAREAHIPVLVADAQDESTFTSPATLRDGDLQVAVSTGGADPVLAREVRERIVAALGPGWGATIAAARKARQERLGRQDQPE